MARYDQTYTTLARRALRQGLVDIETFVERAVTSGMSERRVREQLIQDLEQGGPIFGKFFRSLGSAAEAAVVQAGRQGLNAGMLDPATLPVEDFVALYDDPDPFNNANPQALEDLVQATDAEPYISIAQLVNTCPICLTLHGKTLSLRAWYDQGLAPEQRHEGWTSNCMCVLQPADMAASRKEEIKPLVRNKIKGSRRTARGVTQQDFNRSVNSLWQASETLEGRRILRQLGQVNKDGGTT